MRAEPELTSERLTLLTSLNVEKEENDLREMEEIKYPKQRKNNIMFNLVCYSE